MTKKKFYITAAIPYVNAAPHIGHTLEFVQADTIARYHELLGDDVIFLSGADENAQKNVQSAKANHATPKEWCDLNSQKFADLKKLLNLTDNFVFQRSSARNHYIASQKLWQLCKKDDIKFKKYKGLYCLGCEAFITEKELINGKCPEHPNQELEVVEEKNYFFKLTNYQNELETLIKTDKLKISPANRKHEILSFIVRGLQDFSISRPAERMGGWGIPVPNDSNQIMYVWFDALNVYQSGVGFGSDDKKYNYWWPADLHCIGKGILRFHAVYWPAILLSAGLKLPKEIFVHGYLTIEGQKISKSLGNAIGPDEVVTKYGTDALRYYLLKTIHPYQDGDFSWKLFKEVYNADLANGIGNLVQRVSKLCENKKYSPKFSYPTNYSSLLKSAGFDLHLNNFKFNLAIEEIWKEIKQTDVNINQKKPWELDNKKASEVLGDAVKTIFDVSYDLKPFLPETSEKIEKIFTAEKITAPKQPLFPRIK